MRIETLIQDLRYGVRSLTRTPAFTAVAVLALALGIGANTAIFSVVNGVLLRSLPFRDPDALMMLDEKKPPRFDHFEASPLDFLSWKEQNHFFSGMAAFVSTPFNFSGGDRAERIPGARISADLPAILGVEPIVGRSFTPEEDQAGRDRVVLLGYGLWQRRFGQDRAVIGASVNFNGIPHTVVGVMPPGFRFPQEAEVWKPMGFTPKDLAARSNHFVWVVARLRPGMTREQGQTGMDIIAGRLQRQFPATNTNWSVNVFPLNDHYVGKMRLALIVLLAAVSFVLLIACANVANLLLARASVRQREIAVRASLGASRRRIMQQLLTESVLLALMGGALGLLIARWGLSVVLRLSESLSRFEDLGLDYRALAFTFAVSIVTGLIFGMLPALRLSRINLQSFMSSGARTAGQGMRSHVRTALVVSEVALSLVLLVGAGLLLKSFQRLLRVHPGFDAENILTSKISLPRTKYADPLQQNRFVDDLLGRTRSLPGVLDVAVASSIPFTGTTDAGIYIEGRTLGTPESGTVANYYAVTPEYLRTMRIPLIRGRFFTARDAAGGPAAVIINETMARRFFPNEDPLGRRLDISGPTYMREIVGVVADVKQDGLDARVQPQVYEPFSQKPASSFNILLRVAGNPMRLAETVRHEVSEIDRDQPVSGVATMEEIVSRSMTQRRFSAFLFAAFAALALVLASVGIYGVMAYSVAQRTREIGIRMAVGAQQSGILRLVLGQSLNIVLIGIGVGLAASLALSRFLKSLLYEVQTTDPAIFAGVSSLLLAVALIAAAIPAARAARIDPIVALRSEE